MTVHVSLMAALAPSLVLILLGGAPAQTYEASSFQRDDLHPRLAFDGRMSTRWSAKFSDETAWVQVTYDEPRSFSRVTLRSGIRDLRGAPRDVEVLAGEPGKLRVLGSAKGNTEDDLVVKFRKTKARTWRIDIKARVNPRWSPTLSEIELSDAKKAAAARDEKPSSPYRASDPGLAGHEPERAFDGDIRTRFEARKKGEVWLEVRHEEPQTFDAMSLRVEAEGGYGVPRAFTLQVRSGRRWSKVASAKDVFANRTRLRFRPRSGREWRLVIHAVVDDDGPPRVGELELVRLGDGGWPADPEVAVDQLKVNAAIDKGVAWLKDNRRADGQWPTSHRKEYPMGVLALVGLALSKSGLDRDDPLILDIVSRLRYLPQQKVYSVALHAMFLRAVSIKRYNDRIKGCADYLIEHQAPDGLWGYPTGRSDLSNAQYALLGLKAARDVGVAVPDKVFQRTFDFLLRGAQKDGGFNYVPHGRRAHDPATGSMTAAALACIKLCAEGLPKDRGRLTASAPVVAAARRWLGERFVVEMNPGSHQSHYYYLYGIERVGGYYDTRTIGEHHWYPEGAAHLLKWQRRDGSWHRNVEDTCFALLFLNRASVTGTGR